MTFVPGISEKQSHETRYWHLERLGSVLTKTTDGYSFTDSRSYDAFGLRTGGANGQPFGFAGAYGYQEDASGLKLLGHRYYDPSTGRFISPDPIRAGRSWFGYSGNNPAYFVDPTGLEERRITGFTRHGINHLISRNNVGVSNEASLDAVSNGSMVRQADGTIKYVGRNAVVIVNRDGKVITCWPLSRTGYRTAANGSSLGVITTIIVGADVFMRGTAQIVKYRRRLNNHVRAIDDDNEEAYIGEGVSKGG